MKFNLTASFQVSSRFYRRRLKVPNIQDIAKDESKYLFKKL